jgi:hypothetical protein
MGSLNSKGMSGRDKYAEKDKRTWEVGREKEWWWKGGSD